MTSSDFRARAREQLDNNIFSEKWLMAIAATFIVSTLSGIAGSVVPYIGGLLVIGPLSCGLSSIFLKQARDGQPIDLGDLFKGFKSDFLEQFLLGLMIGIFTSLWSMLFVIPGIIKAYYYSMAFYIKVDNPTWGWRDCIDESRKKMDGHKMDLFILDLSFIGWILLGSMVCGLGVLWVVPYMNAAHAHFYESIR